jgi:hypothetical protein
MDTILRLLLAIVAVPLLLLLALLSAMVNAVALVINIPLSLIMWLFWLCGNWKIWWPVQRTLRVCERGTHYVRLAFDSSG